MTLQEIIDIFIRIPSGGVLTQENRYDDLFIESAVHRVRSTAIFAYWQKTKRINPIWTQQFVPVFNEALQEDDLCKVIFPCPAPVNLDEQMDGFLYIGTEDGNCPYRKVVSRAELANANKHRSIKITKDIVKVLYSDGNLEVYGNTDLKKIRVDGIFQNPTLIPTYNRDIDPYPVDEALIDMMKNIYYQTEAQVVVARPGGTAPFVNDPAQTK